MNLIRTVTMAPSTCRHCGLVQCRLHMNQFGLTRAAGAVCPGALTTTSVLAATGRLDHPSIASYNRHGLREKLSGRPAKSEVPDTVAPTHSTASRGRFATLGKSSRYFNHPKTIQCPLPQNLCRTRAGSAYIAHIAPPPSRATAKVRAG